LLKGGVELSPYFNDDSPPTGKPNPQVAIGVSADPRRAWIIAFDGREEGTSMDATFLEVASTFRVLGASDAMGFDGGGSVTLALRNSMGQIEALNTPIQDGVPGREWPVANQVLVYFK
jgi:exopolysaccharide biosynthesis protein